MTEDDVEASARVEAAPQPGEITRWLARWQAGDQDAFDRLAPLVYEELRRHAGGLMRRERLGHTLEPTALVHEALLRLDAAGALDLASRQQFFALAATVMRRFLVDHARRRKADKRGGDLTLVPIVGDEQVIGERGAERWIDVLEVDRALGRLERISSRRARVVELRFFAGLEVPEIAAALGASVSTVEREWRAARAYLAAHLGGLAGAGGAG